MRVECLKSFAGTMFSGTTGEVKDFPDDTANDLIRAGYAREVKGTKAAKEEKDESQRDNDGDNMPTAPRGRKRTGKQ